jgi:hypothetical protein
VHPQKQVKAYKQAVHPQQSRLSAKIADSSDRVVLHMITHPSDINKSTNN